MVSTTVRSELEGLGYLFCMGPKYRYGSGSLGSLDQDGVVDSPILLRMMTGRFGYSMHSHGERRFRSSPKA